jgi:hypothetical protein
MSIWWPFFYNKINNDNNSFDTVAPSSRIDVLYMVSLISCSVENHITQMSSGYSATEVVHLNPSNSNLAHIESQHLRLLTSIKPGEQSVFKSTFSVWRKNTNSYHTYAHKLLLYF